MIRKTARERGYTSPTLLRRVQVYPSPKYFRLMEAYVHANEMNESEGVSVMIRQFFDNMSEADRQRIIEVSNNKK